MLQARELDFESQRFAPNDFDCERLRELNMTLVFVKKSYEPKISSNEVLIKVMRKMDKKLPTVDVGEIEKFDEGNKVEYKNYDEVTNMILTVVSDVAGQELNDIRSKCRLSIYAVPRQIMTFLIRWCTEYSLKTIAEKISLKKQDHATVIHSCIKIKDAISTKDRDIYPMLKKSIEVLNRNHGLGIDFNNAPSWFKKERVEKSKEYWKSRRLTDTEVNEIRASKTRTKTLAKKYEVAASVISAVKHFKTYKNVKKRKYTKTIIN